MIVEIASDVCGVPFGVCASVKGRVNVDFSSLYIDADGHEPFPLGDVLFEPGDKLASDSSRDDKDQTVRFRRFFQPARQARMA